jgi:hypothetical protein
LLVLDPSGTLLKVALLCLAAGALWSTAAALFIYVGATQVPPRIPRGQVWAQWRKRRLLWCLTVLGAFVGTLWTSDLLYQRHGLIDLYWINRRAELEWIARLGGLCGLLLVFMVLVTVGLVLRGRARKRGKGPAV